jgi:AraC-like DNA-binding protein
MDKKIPKKDKSKIVDVVFDRSKSFSNNIVDFAEIFKYPMSSSNSLIFDKHKEKCNMIAYQLNSFIEIGYFYFKLKKSVRIIGSPSSNKRKVVLSYIFGTNKNHITRVEDSQKEGVSNSVFIHSNQINTINSIDGGSEFYLLKISFKKKILKKLFGMPKSIMSELLNKENLEIIYVELNSKIINTIESMELKSLPRTTKIPYLLGKSYELLALTIDGIVSRSKNQSLKFSPMEIEKLLRVKSFILSDWKNPPTTQRVSKFLGMSPTKAKVLFKQFYGKPIYKFFNEKRLEEGMNMINQGHHTVTEIGRLLGFKTPSHFAESFKKKYHVLPKKLSKAIK